MLELIGVDGLTQWDVGRQIKVDKDINMVHFSNRPYGYSKNVKVTNGVADVPDMFLTSCAPLRVWAYVGDFEKGYTKIEKIYEVKPKNRPEDYIYTPEEVKTWEKLQSEIGDLSNLETKAKENLVVAINEVAADMSEGVALDTTLTQSGQAADAKAVGDALAEKANIPDIPAALPNPNALTFTGAVTGSYDGSAAVTVNIPSGGSGGTDISLGLTSAAVGQIIKVKAVDESGKPTAWEAADIAGGSDSGSGIHLIARVVTEANAASIEVTGLSTTAEVLSLRIYNQGSTCGNGLNITVNGVQKKGFAGGNRGENTDRALVRAWLYRDGGTLYGRSRMANEGTNAYEWPEMGEITSIAVDSNYNDGTTKYFQAGTIFEIYEGVYPNVN